MKTYFSGWIKPGNYKKKVIDGIEYTSLYRWWVIPMLRTVKFIQKSLWLCGIAIHDPVFGECTPDFNCCCKIGRKAFLRLSQTITKREYE